MIGREIMTEKNSAGIKEMIYSVLWAVVILIGYDITQTAMKLALGEGYKGRDLILTCALILAGCVLVYIVLTRYASTFIYEINEKSVCITRKIGHRERKYDIKNKDIRYISKTQPNMSIEKSYKMKKTVFSHRSTYYLVYLQNGRLNMIEFEPSDAMAKEIEKKIKVG